VIAPGGLINPGLTDAQVLDKDGIWKIRGLLEEVE